MPPAINENGEEVIPFVNQRKKYGAGSDSSSGLSSVEWSSDEGFEKIFPVEKKNERSGSSRGESTRLSNALASQAGDREEESENPDQVTKVRYGPFQTEGIVREEKGLERTREFYGPTDDENALAAVRCQEMINQVAAEEPPKKQALWDEVSIWAEKNNIRSECPYKDWLRYEWPEKLHIREYLRRRLASIPIELCPNEDKTMAAQLSYNPKQIIEPSIPERTITTSIHIKDLNGESLIIKINTGIEELFEGTPEVPMYKYILDTMDRLENDGVPAPEPTNKDLRHPTNNFRIAKEYWNKKGKPCGVFHFACWCQTGHAHSAFDYKSGPWNHLLSRDVLGNRGTDVNLRLRFLVEMAPVQQAMSLWFEAIDEDRYKLYRGHVDFLEEEDAGVSLIKFANNQSFLGLANLRNVQVHNHKDKGDVRDGWVGMACTGSFTGGELCLLDLELKLRFLPGDVVFFRSCVLQHFVRQTIGERSSLVFFSHSSPRTISQNVRYMAANDPIVEWARQKRVSVEGKKQKMEDRKKAFAHLPPYTTVEADLTERNLRHARARKKRFLRHARTALHKGEISKEQARKIWDAPVASFYEFSLSELMRHSKGLYPFKNEIRRR